MTDTDQSDPDGQSSGELYSHANHWEDVFRDEFSKESDRAAVILAASMFDNSLHDLLKSHFAPNPSSTDDLFDGSNAPLSTFSSKITIAYRLGLVSERFSRGLHLIRKIRNEFAHNITGCSFQDSRVRSRVLELYRDTDPSCVEEWRDAYPDGTRGDFMMVCSWMLWSLNALSEHCEQIENTQFEFGYLHNDGSIE